MMLALLEITPQIYSFFAENNQTRTHLLNKSEEKQEGRNEVSKINAIFAPSKETKSIITMTNNATMQGVYVNVPVVDWSLFRELVRKFGWQVETREQMLDRFLSSRPTEPSLSEEEIMDEVRAVRYTK